MPWTQSGSPSSVRVLRRLLLTKHGPPHDGILTGHSPSQCALDLGSQRQLVQVFLLLRSWDEALPQEGLALQALHSFRVRLDLCQSRVSAGQASAAAVRRCKRRGFADGRESLRMAIGELFRVSQKSVNEQRRDKLGADPLSCES